VASYLAKYATKSTEAVGPVAARITPRRPDHASPPVEQLGVTGRGTSNLLDV
jgi:hypothetical protein